MAITESQQAQQLAQQPQSASVHEKSNLDNHRDVSVPEDEGLFPFFVHCFIHASDEFLLDLCLKCLVIKTIYR